MSVFNNFTQGFVVGVILAALFLLIAQFIYQKYFPDRYKLTQEIMKMEEEKKRRDKK